MLLVNYIPAPQICNGKSDQILPLTGKGQPRHTRGDTAKRGYMIFYGKVTMILKGKV